MFIILDIDTINGHYNADQNIICNSVNDGLSLYKQT